MSCHSRIDYLVNAFVKIRQSRLCARGLVKHVSGGECPRGWKSPNWVISFRSLGNWNSVRHTHTHTKDKGATKEAERLIIYIIYIIKI